MQIQPLNKKVLKQIKKFGIEKKCQKQMSLFIENPLHPSLNLEKLEPKHVGLYSFRVDKFYRAIFRIKNKTAVIILITKHYQ